MSINNVSRTPNSTDYKYSKVEAKKEQQGNKQQQKDDQQQKKKKNEKMDNLFSSLADNLSSYGDI